MNYLSEIISGLNEIFPDKKRKFMCPASGVIDPVRQLQYLRKQGILIS